MSRPQPAKLDLYRKLLRIRKVEEEIARIYPTDRIKSPVHLSIGQESASIAVCEALQTEDIVYGTYRGHALYLGRGGSLKRMMAELFGKVGGCARGKGGSMHLIARECGMMGASAVVGTTIANAVGHAFSLRYQGTNAIVASFFGDGATEEGVFAESLNFAVLKKLPVLFICENNQYAIHTHQSKRQGKPGICDRARSHGMPAEKLDANSIWENMERIGASVERIRQGEGPAFFEIMTYRWNEHVGPGHDYHLGYRERSELEPWLEADALNQLGKSIDPDTRLAIATEIDQEIARAVAYAEASPFPDPSELTTDVFKEEIDAGYQTTSSKSRTVIRR